MIPIKRSSEEILWVFFQIVIGSIVCSWSLQPLFLIIVEKYCNARYKCDLPKIITQTQNMFFSDLNLKPSASYSCLPAFDLHCSCSFSSPYSESVTVTHQDSSNIYQTCCSKVAQSLHLFILKDCPAAC